MYRFSICRQWAVVCAAITGLLSSGIVAAGGAGSQSPLLNVSFGQVGIDRSVRSPGRYGLEYRMRPVGRYRIVPAVGFAWADNGANFVYAELKRDFRFDSGVVVTPSFGFGRFDASSDFQLGQALEFRSGLEIAYERRDRYRIGIALFHLSNGGLATENPGAEELVLTFSLPRD